MWRNYLRNHLIQAKPVLIKNGGLEAMHLFSLRKAFERISVAGMFFAEVFGCF